ncbi:bifunctional oligoribonuclease/PAP phosphatase NrnA [Actinoplanes sp. LDG1-06]|uniref:Bifunctional oligoribonuclease/PAP phosphatase NrnA n=1 Tax=Paractinoplanes ovalisporus TaxID=2810368 RepID=A0ABS2ACX2_9ACTN|nr:bifunctional oligoribonuclease/PAP phosphatase NrnA [Actinoplanes ovalisporus]MBM2617671.1 bifunctional oligoribonuclease/PAP phosphatase NrnA [Actinoplanes ovalisporus]
MRPGTEPGRSSSGIRDRDWDAAVAAIRSVPLDAEVQLICHVNPDGDALGSMLGFALGLRQLGFTGLRATFPGEFDVPEPYRALPGADLLVEEREAYAEPALILIFDVASESRLVGLAGRLDGAAPVVVLDHHASNTSFGDVNLVDPAAVATSVVADELLVRLGVELDAEIAECLYVALATDTGSFKFVRSPSVHTLAARLIATGISPGEIARRIFDTRPFGAMKLAGEVLGRALLEPEAAGGHGMVWTYATNADLERHHQRPYVLDSLIDPVRGVAEADVAVVVKELVPGEWSVSLRSKGGVDVSAVAVALGGGGHRLAAGFTAYGTPGEVIAQIRPLLDANLA